jgi:hypothetical protein
MHQLTRRVRRTLNTRLPLGRLLAVAALSLTMAATAACGSDSKDTTGPNRPNEPNEPAEPGPNPGPEPGLEGSYTLSGVRDGSLPETIYDGPATVDGQSYERVEIVVTGGQLELDGERYQSAIRLELTLDGAPGESTITDQGTFSIDGNTLAFTSDDPQAGTAEGWADDETLTVMIELVGGAGALAYTFEK